MFGNLNEGNSKFARCNERSGNPAVELWNDNSSYRAFSCSRLERGREREVANRESRKSQNVYDCSYTLSQQKEMIKH